MSDGRTSTSVVYGRLQAEGVDLVASSGRSIGSVAKELDLRDSILRRWVSRRQRVGDDASRCFRIWRLPYRAQRQDIGSLVIDASQKIKTAVNDSPGLGASNQLLQSPIMIFVGLVQFSRFESSCGLYNSPSLKELTRASASKTILAFIKSMTG